MLPRAILNGDFHPGAMMMEEEDEEEEAAGLGGSDSLPVPVRAWDHRTFGLQTLKLESRWLEWNETNPRREVSEKGGERKESRYPFFDFLFFSRSSPLVPAVAR